MRACTLGLLAQHAVTTKPAIAAAEWTENLCYLSDNLINIYTAASPPDHYPKGGGQLPNPNKCNSALTRELGERR